MTETRIQDAQNIDRLITTIGTQEPLPGSGLMTQGTVLKSRPATQDVGSGLEIQEPLQGLGRNTRGDEIQDLIRGGPIEADINQMTVVLTEDNHNTCVKGGQHRLKTYTIQHNSVEYAFCI